MGRSSNDSGRQQRAGLFEWGARGRTEETVVTYLGKAAQQGVLQEAADKLYRRERDAVELLAAIASGLRCASLTPSPDAVSTISR